MFSSQNNNCRPQLQGITAKNKGGDQEGAGGGRAGKMGAYVWTNVGEELAGRGEGGVQGQEALNHGANIASTGGADVFDGSRRPKNIFLKVGTSGERVQKLEKIESGSKRAGKIFKSKLSRVDQRGGGEKKGG